jgi:hypothetical protein
MKSGIQYGRELLRDRPDIFIGVGIGAIAATVFLVAASTSYPRALNHMLVTNEQLQAMLNDPQTVLLFGKDLKKQIWLVNAAHPSL